MRSLLARSPHRPRRAGARHGDRRLPARPGRGPLPARPPGRALHPLRRCRPTSRRPRASSTSTAPRPTRPTVAGREALAVHHLVEPITSPLAERGHGRAVRHDREPARAGAGPDGARRRRRRRRRAARSSTPASPPTSQRLGVELKEVVGRDDLNINSPIQLREILYAAPPAGRGLTPIKKTKTGASTDAATLEKLRDRVARVHRPAAAVPRGREAARHVRRGPARRGRRRRAHPRHVQPDRRPHRPAQLGPPEPAQHPGAPGGGPAVPQGVRRRAGRQAARRRLQPDRAALHRPPRRRPGPDRRVHRAARTSTTPRRRGSSTSPRSTSRSTSARRRRWCPTAWPTGWRPTGSGSA